MYDEISENTINASTAHPSTTSLAQSRGSSKHSESKSYPINSPNNNSMSFWSISSGDGYETGRERWNSGEASGGWTSSYYSVAESRFSGGTLHRGDASNNSHSNYSGKSNYSSDSSGSKGIIRARIPSVPPPVSKLAVNAKVMSGDRFSIPAPPSRSSSLASCSSNSSVISRKKRPTSPPPPVPCAVSKTSRPTSRIIEGIENGDFYPRITA